MCQSGRDASAHVMDAAGSTIGESRAGWWAPHARLSSCMHVVCGAAGMHARQHPRRPVARVHARLLDITPAACEPHHGWHVAGLGVVAFPPGEKQPSWQMEQVGLPAHPGAHALQADAAVWSLPRIVVVPLGHCVQFVVGGKLPALQVPIGQFAQPAPPVPGWHKRTATALVPGRGAVAVGRRWMTGALGCATAGVITQNAWRRRQSQGRICCGARPRRGGAPVAGARAGLVRWRVAATGGTGGAAAARAAADWPRGPAGGRVYLAS